MLKLIYEKAATLRRFVKKPSSFKTNLKVINWATKSPRRASFYYYFINENFSREHQSVLCGKESNITNDIESLSISSMLRRNLHRIEKGLTTYPPKPVFAGEYIIETIRALYLFFENCNDGHTLKWAVDVLNSYFSTVNKEGDIALAKEQFIEFKNTHHLNIENWGYHGPYLKKEIERSSVGYKDFLSLCHQRHSIRWYEDKTVPINMVKKGIDAALLAPSACNRQAFRFVIVESPGILQEALQIPIGCATFASNVPLFVALIGDLSAYFDERDRHLIYIDGGLAAMNLMLSLETMGLSSCPINWPDIKEREEAASLLFNMKKYERGILFFSIGYPLSEGGVAFSARKETNQVTTIL